MNNEFQWWLLVVGIALGAALVWFLIGSIPRTDDDVTESERALEAEWISGVIEERGGVAPALLVEEVLDLHRAYLRRTPLEVPDDEPEAADLEEESVAGAADAEEASDERSVPTRAAYVGAPRMRQSVPERTGADPSTSSLTMNRSPDLPGSAS